MHHKFTIEEIFGDDDFSEKKIIVDDDATYDDGPLAVPSGCTCKQTKYKTLYLNKLQTGIVKFTRTNLRAVISTEYYRVDFNNCYKFNSDYYINLLKSILTNYC